MGPAPETLRDVSVQLPAELVDYLIKESERAGVKPADILQQAITNFRFLREHVNAGGSVLLDEKGKALQKVELPSS